jgi:hypothetical protein
VGLHGDRDAIQFFHRRHVCLLKRELSGRTGASQRRPVPSPMRGVVRKERP